MSAVMTSYKTKKIKLTKENYFTPENTAISNSKVSDFLKSKEYYYKKHILHEIDPEETVPLKIGKMVDCILSGEPVPYQASVLKKDNPELYEYQKTLPDNLFITENQWEEAQKRAQAITREPFYQDYLQHSKFQVILQGTYKRIQICGVIDVLTETVDTIYIDDFKSSSEMKATNSKWFWNCVESGYFRQMGAYSYMINKRYNRKKKKIICRHIVVWKESRDLYKVKLYILPDLMINVGTEEFLAGVKMIKKEKNWFDEPITWDKAELLKNPIKEFSLAPEVCDSFEAEILQS